MSVVDASVVVEVLLGTARGRALMERLINEPMDAPELLDVEVASVLRRLVREGRVSAERGEIALLQLAQLDVRRHGHRPLLPRIWALRGHITAYDAAYVALAEGLGTRMLSLDTRLAAALPRVVEAA